MTATTQRQRRRPAAFGLSRPARARWINVLVVATVIVIFVALTVAGCGRARTTEFIGYACGLPPPLPTVASNPWNCGSRCFADENLVGLPGGPASLFTHPVDGSPASQQTIIYPLAGALFPLNLGGIDLQWHLGMGGAQAYFRAQLTAVADPSRVYTLYVPCRRPPANPSPPAADACTYGISRALWTAIAAENPDSQLDLQLAGGDAAANTISQSAPVRFGFGPSSVHGGIYYWSSEGQSVFRGILGGGPAQPFLTPPIAGRFPCGGCHSASHDGRLLAFSGQQNDYVEEGTLAVVAAQGPPATVLAPAQGTGGDGATMSLNRDGSLVAVSFGATVDPGHLAVRETATGRQLARLDPDPSTIGGGRFFFPEWSPDGRALVATAAEGSVRPWSVNGGSIVVLPFGGDSFGNPRVVVPQDDAHGLFHFYPTWSPDGAWIAFASAPLPGPSYANAQSRLRLVASAGGQIYELANATQGIGKTSTYPRFAPVMQDQCNVLYLTFHSKMDYGLLVQNSLQPTADAELPQLWMTAIDLRALGSGDPSRPPVWLPFQMAQQKNLLGTWSERIVCSGQSDCGAATDATCDAALGACVPAPP